MCVCVYVCVCLSQETQSWKAHVRKKSGGNILDDEVSAAKPSFPDKSATHLHVHVYKYCM